MKSHNITFVMILLYHFVNFQFQPRNDPTTSDPNNTPETLVCQDVNGANNQIILDERKAANTETDDNKLEKCVEGLDKQCNNKARDSRVTIFQTRTEV